MKKLLVYETSNGKINFKWELEYDTDEELMKSFFEKAKEGYLCSIKEVPLRIVINVKAEFRRLNDNEKIMRGDYISEPTNINSPRIITSTDFFGKSVGYFASTIYFWRFQKFVD